MMDSADVRWPPSLWVAVTPPAPDLPQLVGHRRSRCIVIGAGFTGLSTALHLREAGVDVAIVEAIEPGWGASGRNNGQVIPTLSRPDPDDIVARHGAAGERFVALVARQRLDVVRCRAALSNSGRAGAVRLGAAGAFAGPHQDRRTPGTAVVEIRRAGRAAIPRPDPRACWARTPGSAVSGTRTGGHINPLALSRGLARAVIERGVRIYAARPPSALNGGTTDGWSKPNGARSAAGP